MLILKKLSQTSCIGVPLSSQEKTGSWYITVTHSDGKKNTINLAQIRYIDFRRFDKKLGTLDTDDFRRVQMQLKNLLNL